MELKSNMRMLIATARRSAHKRWLWQRAKAMQPALRHCSLLALTSSISCSRCVPTAYRRRDVFRPRLTTSVSLQVGQTALMAAARSGHAKAVRVLLDAGAEHPSARKKVRCPPTTRAFRSCVWAP